jgi:phospholipid/cholesterol/gamma-HCH transport system substrate-binding protein
MTPVRIAQVAMRQLVARRPVAAAVAACVAVGTLAGCGGLQLERLPAPKNVSGPTYRITANFRDVQNLSIGAQVKLQGVVVGEVESIKSRDYQAVIGMDIEKKFPLARTATFQIRFTTPLGEDYIAVTSTAGPGAPVLSNGATVPASQTGDAPGIEDTFAALSLLLNGGGLDKLHTIVSELDTAFKGHTSDARDALQQLDKVLTNFDSHKSDFDKALTGLAAMAKALNSGAGIVQQALVQFPPTLRLLAGDTDQVKQLLTKVARLGDTVKGLLQRSQSDTLTYFDQLRPTLDALRAAQSQLEPSFTSLIAFGKLVDRAAPGDYFNLDATINVPLNSPPARPGASGYAPSSVTPASASAEDAIAAVLTGGLR